MSPPIDHPCLYLHVLPGAFFVRKLEPAKLGDTLKSLTENDGEGFLSITRTGEELSVVGQYREGMPEAYKELAGWRAIKIAGPMEFSEFGQTSNIYFDSFSFPRLDRCTLRVCRALEAS
jgi:hypothetical protein